MTTSQLNAGTEAMDSKFRAFGLRRGGEEQTEVVKEEATDTSDETFEVDEESGEPIEADTSDETSQDESLEADNDEPVSTNDSGNGADTSLAKRLSKAENEVKKLQSNKDKEVQATINRLNAQHRADMERLHESFQEFKQQQTDEETEAIGDDDLITGKQLKALQKKEAAKPSKTAKVSVSPEGQSWLTSQADYNEVSQFIRDNNLQNDAELMNVPTDTVGLYQTVRARMAEDKATRFDKVQAELKKVRAENKKLKGQKGSIPPTGGSGASPGRNQSHESQPESQFEREFFGTFKKRGFNPQIVTKGR